MTATRGVPWGSACWGHSWTQLENARNRPASLTRICVNSMCQPLEVSGLQASWTQPDCSPKQAPGWAPRLRFRCFSNNKSKRNLNNGSVFNDLQVLCFDAAPPHRSPTSLPSQTQTLGRAGQGRNRHAHFRDGEAKAQRGACAFRGQPMAARHRLAALVCQGYFCPSVLHHEAFLLPVPSYPQAGPAGHKPPPASWLGVEVSFVCVKATGWGSVGVCDSAR